ncbi:GNAT family N-acetyltransferase [Nocardioides sp. GXQ0305]|uniref:GNAT family N-acetyltransferase n=1 Tax=Nocardioides sp. GXQ0305 TaxID=3423912 RepID=UPI003D7E003B
MSTDLDVDRVRAAAGRWVFVPVDATEVRTEEYRLIHLADVSAVHGSVTARPVADVLQEVLGQAREACRPTLQWWVDTRTVPADTEEQLAAAGLRMTQRLEVLALPVSTRLPVPEDVEVVEVRDRPGLELAGRLQSEVFGIPRPSDAVLDDQLRSVTVPDAEQLVRCYVAHVDGEPAGSGGGTVDGDALRFWDGSVLPAYRGRGVYRALVARRLADARATTADFALVKAVDDTSAPILRRLGFRPYGEQRCWSTPVPR